MPMYEVEHVAPLTRKQKDDLAARITSIHSTLFTTPVLFINVRFTDVSDQELYVSGRRSNTNRIIAFVRPGGGRGTEQWNRLIGELGEAWTDVVERGSDAAAAAQQQGDFKLRATFVNASIVAGLEKGFFRPVAGQERQWLNDNMAAFRKLADEGDEEMAFLVKEVHERDML